MGEARRESAHLLVVDEWEENLQILETVLRRNGYRVTCATDGPSGLRAAGEDLPDLILLDVMMPRMDGYDVCRRLKEDVRTRDVPVLFISVYSQTDEKLKGFEAGAVDYVSKPFSIPELLARVRTHLALRSTQAVLGSKEKQLRRFQQAIENTGDAVMLTDATGRPIHVNWAFEQLTGRGLSSVASVGGLRPLFADRSILREVLRQVRSGIPWQGELDLLNRQKIRVPAELRVDAIRDERGKVIGLVGIGRSIGDRLRAEAVEKKTERSRVLVETAGAAAHEINQPLSVVVGMSQMLIGLGVGREVKEDDLTQIHQAGLEIQEIVKRMEEARSYVSKPYVGATSIVDLRAVGREEA